MTKKVLIFLLAYSVGWSQTAVVNGKLVIDSSMMAKKLYGSRLPVLHGSAQVSNQGPATVNINTSTINLALSTVPTVSSSEGQALVNQSFAKEPASRVMNILTMVAAGVGLASGVGSAVHIGAKALAYLLFGVAFGNQGVLPFLQATQIALPTFHPCDQLNVSLAAGQSLNCDVWVEKPPKGYTLQSAVPFTLESVPPNAPPPPVPPVQLRLRADESPSFVPDDVPHGTLAGTAVNLAIAKSLDLPVHSMRPVPVQIAVAAGYCDFQAHSGCLP